MSETDTLDERVNALLTEAEEHAGSLLSSGDEGADGDGTALLEAAEEAANLVEGTPPRDLLEAVGLDRLEDGGEPETIPEAIARGDPERVEDLRRLLRLAKLSHTADDGSDLEGSVGAFRERLEQRADATDAGSMEPGSSETDPADREESEGEEDVDESTGDTDLGDELRSSLESSMGEFGDDVRALRDRLEEAAGSDAGDEDEAAAERADADEVATEERDADDVAEDDVAEDEADADASGDGEEESRFVSNESARLSTVAPRPTERADMKAVRRFSTMPRKRR
ncbi:hypothetical protein ACFQGT_01235 [Natrialbaceae archaeon GCM10025810]|uniref:hypothetical protein n=1 Tax=Halovalidus salilacus TaxID=3075124 RepID=UPI003614888B